MVDMARTPAREKDWREQTRWYTHEVAILRPIKFILGKLILPLAEVKCSGLEYIPAAGPCVIAANHINNFDVVFFGLHLPRHPFFMAKAELYRNPLLSWAIRLAGSFPVNRGEKDPWAMQHAGQVLAAGQALFMFPEGTRGGHEARLGRGKVGAVKLALDHQVPLVPASIFGTQNLSWGRRGRAQISIQVAPPLDLAGLAGPPPYPPDKLRDLTDRLMRQIAAMLPASHRGIYE